MTNILQELTRIITAVSHVSSPAEQVVVIVDSISRVINADVCSLYKVRPNGDLELLASHGLDSSQPVVVTSGNGIVGNIVKNRHTVNIANAQEHPEYFYIPTIGEEKFLSFCGSPLVDHGIVVGVLVVQNVSALALPEEDEAFLSTLASHLAMIVSSMPDSDHKRAGNERVIGISGSPGIGIGEAISIKKPTLENVLPTNCDDAVNEKRVWRLLTEKVALQIEQEKNQIGTVTGSNIEGVFTAFQLFLSDKQFITLVEQAIDAGASLPFALKQAILNISSVFQAMDDPYLKARSDDIWHLGNRLYAQWLDQPLQARTDIKPDSPIVLVGKHIDISDISTFSHLNVVGLVSCEGSALSHVSVVANALGIPAIIGIDPNKMPASDLTVIVDGNEGVLIRQPSKAILREYNALVGKERSLSAEFDTVRHLPSSTIDGYKVQLFANTGLLTDLSPGIKFGAEGIGLYRTEMPFLIRDSFPTEDEQIDIYKKVFNAYNDKPVYMRTLDVGSDKQLPYFPTGNEDNPALGWRGIRFALDNVQLLVTQLRAMLKASEGHDNFHVLIPMVVSTSEIDAFIELVHDAVRQLREEGSTVKTPKIGIMIEVPGAISQIGFWRQKIDFVSIGSNDLSQYLLAVDRNNYRVANRFDHVHPAIVQELYRISVSAKANNLPICLCGEMGSNPIAVALLLGMGISTLSLSSSRIPKIKYLIRHLSIERCEQFLQQALCLDNVDEIRQLGVEMIKDSGLQGFVD